jgi:hypothetical protein
MATKDFFCSGKDCAEIRNIEKKGGPNIEFDYQFTLCEENKAKLTNLVDLMKTAKEEVDLNVTFNPIITFGVNVGVNIATQMIFAAFDADVKDLKGAWDKVSILQALGDGVVDMFSPKKWQLLINFGYNFAICLAKKEQIDQNDVIECGLFSMIDLIAGELITKYGIKGLKAGLRKFGVNEVKIQKYLGIKPEPKVKNIPIVAAKTAEEEAIEKIVKKKVVNGAGNPFKLPSAKGLIGKNFEEFLAKNLPDGESGFMKGGRDFDAVYGNPKKWVEAKSGGYWINQTSSESGLAKFKSDMGDRLRISKENGVDYELFSNTSIPDNIKTWLNGKGIKYYEILE